MCERICNYAMIPKHMTRPPKNPWCSTGALCSNHTQTNYAPFSLSASIHFHLPLQGRVRIRGDERETLSPRVPLFSKIPHTPFGSFALSFVWRLPVIDRIYIEMTTASNQFGQNAKKRRVVNTVLTNFDTFAWLTTESSHSKKQVFVLFC